MQVSPVARISDFARSLPPAWRLLGSEQRVAAIGSLLLIVSTFGSFTFVEAAEVLTALGVLMLLKRRAEGSVFHLPFGDGTAVAAAGAWCALLILIRFFDRPPGQSLLALACAALMFGAGMRERAKRPMDDLPPEAVRVPRGGPRPGDGGAAKPPPSAGEPLGGDTGVTERVPGDRDAADRIPGDSGSLPRRPRDSGATNEIPDEDEITWRIPGDFDLTDRVRGKDDVTRRVPRDRDATDRIPGDRDATDRIPGRDDVTRRIAPDRDATDRIPGDRDATDRIPGDRDATNRIPGGDDVTRRKPSDRDATDRIAPDRHSTDRISERPGPESPPEAPRQ